MHTTALNELFSALDASRTAPHRHIPPKADTEQFVDDLFLFLFPILDNAHLPAQVRYPLLRHHLLELLLPLLQGSEQHAAATADAFFEGLGDVYHRLQEDAGAFLDFDPAASCIEEVIATYPGFFSIAIYRISHLLHELGVPLLPRFFAEYAHGRTGIDIHPAAEIGHSFFIDHGTGVVIGQTAVIGNHVKIYQGVTLGALQVQKSMANTKRHPTIEDNVIIYANSTILGGDTVIGHSSVIGGNSWITGSIAPYSVVLHQPQVKVRSKPFEEPINFVI
jgi:serine O-acetyltransferase